MTIDHRFLDYEKHYASRGQRLYYGLLFAPPTVRHALIAIAGIQDSLHKITQQSTEPSIREGKLAWWQMEFNRLFAGNPEHPLTQMLISQPLRPENPDVLPIHILPPALFQEWIEGTRIQLQADHFCTMEDLSFFTYRQQGIPHLLMAYLLTYPELPLFREIEGLSTSLCLTTQLITLKTQLMRGFCLFPLNWLNEANIKEQDLLASDWPAGVYALIDRLVDMIETAYQRGRQCCLNSAQRVSLLPLLIEAGLANQQLKAMLKKGLPQDGRLIDCSPFQKIWTTLGIAYTFRE
jgi:15-cis-phytoene synthase